MLINILLYVGDTNSHSFQKPVFLDFNDGRMAKIGKVEDTGGQVKAHNVESTGYPRKVSRIEVFLSVVGDEVIIKTIYSDSNCLTTTSASTPPQ